MALKVPPVALLEFQLRQTQVVDFEQRIKFHGFTDSYNAAMCRMLTNERATCVRAFVEHAKRPEIDPEPARQAVTRYMSFLSGFMWHPESVGHTPSKIKNILYFYWTPTLAQQTNFADNNAFHEAANVLTNLALILLNWAARRVAMRSPSTRDLIEKEAYGACCEAAGLLQQAASWLTTYPSVQTQIPGEAMPEFYASLSSFALAQAQELGALRALNMQAEKAQIREATQPELVTKLLHQCATLYQAARAACSRLGLTSDAFQAFLSVCEAKESAYIAYAWLGMGLAENKASKNGSAMKCAAHAKEIGSRAVLLSKKPRKPLKWLTDVCQAASEEAAQKASKFEMENRSIFHQKIAEDLPELLPVQILARPRDYSFPMQATEWNAQVYEQFVPKLPSAMGGGAGGHSQHGTAPASTQPQAPPHADPHNPAYPVGGAGQANHAGHPGAPPGGPPGAPPGPPGAGGSAPPPSTTGHGGGHGFSFF